jgi:hypothetical protein
MSDVIEQAEKAADKLLKADENQLYEQLGIRAKAMAKDPTKGSSFDPDVTYDGAEMGLLDDVKTFGRRLFRRYLAEIHKIMCGSDPDDQKARETLVKKFGLSEVAVTGALSALLVTHLGLAAAIAAAIAALIVKLFFRPTYEEFCQVWKENLPQG